MERSQRFQCNAMGADQRKFLRKALEVDFEATDAQGDGQLVFTTADLSLGGVFIKSDVLLELDERLTLSVRLPNGTRFDAKARVAWVRSFPEGDEPAGMGVEFTELSDADRAAVQGFLAA